jgi:hypothetical protein
MTFLIYKKHFFSIAICCFAIQNIQAQKHTFAIWGGIGTHRQHIDIKSNGLNFKKVNEEINHNYSMKYTFCVSKNFQFEYGFSEYKSESVYNINYNFMNPEASQDNTNLKLKNAYFNMDFSVLMSVYNTDKINLGIKLGASVLENSNIYKEEKYVLSSDNQIFGKITTSDNKFMDGCLIFGFSAQKKMSRRFITGLNYRKIIGGNRLNKISYINLENVNGHKVHAHIGTTSIYSSFELSFGYIIY